ncbi:FAD dependent oxidoreductase [Xylogone sp. PMI_703]|nr:FAD dependent oxidoreductase [Xylogone sp. PMI_703]
MSEKLSHHDTILIVGAGVFGLSTALELSQRGYKNITVIDRMLPPVPDGSSVDVSRIIRCDYSDPFYMRLGTEAIKAWSSGPFRPYYYNSGFVLTSEEKHDVFLEKLKGLLRSQGLQFKDFKTTQELIRAFPHLKDVKHDFTGYINPNAGWADAAGAIRALASLCSEAGVSFITGSRGTLTSLKVDNSRVVGVNVSEGPPILASKVILATGAWTNRYLDLTHAVASSAQPVGFIQLTPEEAKEISQIPVVINMTSGFFIFPPTPYNHILKVARHSHGFDTTVKVDGRVISAPKADTNNATSSYLPDDADQALREGLRQVVPKFAEKPWMRRRLCWYTDTPQGNFVVDNHPSIKGLFIAVGGAGHGFKFLPILGRYIADCFEDRASTEVRQKWRLETGSAASGPMVCNDGSRRGPARRLLTSQEQAKL